MATEIEPFKARLHKASKIDLERQHQHLLQISDSFEFSRDTQIGQH